jgi:hypothetical protein
LGAITDVSIDVTTLYEPVRSERGTESVEDRVRTEAVIKDVLPECRVLPNDRVLFEPDYDEDGRFEYPKGRFTPSKLTIRLPGSAIPYVWPLGTPIISPMTPSKYDGNRHGSPPWPYTWVIRQFIDFQYFHPFDVDRLHPLRVIYQSNGGCRFALHAVSIRLELLEMIVHRRRELDDDDYYY